MVDVEATAEAIKDAAKGQSSAPLLVVDNTFMTPYLLVS
jgi:cystathionine beta-lyase/cystathionine gamma-synthase